LDCNGDNLPSVGNWNPIDYGPKWRIDKVELTDNILERLIDDLLPVQLSGCVDTE
jgi:hypothetical protein